MIKYFIRTTLERRLDDSVGRELGDDYTLLIDTEHKPIESFIEQLSIISEYDSVLLEDDVILCKNFKQRIEDVISKYKDKLINFFTFPIDYFTSHITFYEFRYNQCTYYPKGISKLIANEMKNLICRKYNFEYDVLEGFAIKNLKLVYLVYRPCLVQHNDIKSLIQNNFNIKRITPYFIDYLEELNISYEDAYKPENKEKLIALMKSKFENYKGEQTNE